MRNTSWLLVVLSCFCAGAAPAAESAEVEARYTQLLNKRGDETLAALKLDDPAKAERVKQLVMDQYRALRAQHDARDAKLEGIPEDEKERVARIHADTDAAIKPLHDAFVEKLSAELTPAQVETVKDRMTMNKVNVDFNAFCDMLPDLTDAQKDHILAQLKEAREIAMDKGSAEEKHAVFGKYRGRINNYLAKQGYDLKQASKDWAARRKARDARAKQDAATQPAH